MSGGITHPPQILCSLAVLGFAADLMSGEGFVVANFSVHPKEEGKGTAEEQINEVTPQLLYFVKGNDIPIPEGTSLSAACQHRQGVAFQARCRQ